MQHAKQWTKEEVQTLNSLRKKKVKITYISKILDRTPAACYSKMWQLTHPDYQPKSKKQPPTPNHMGVIRKLEQELVHAKNVAIQLNRHWEDSKEELKECRMELDECKAELKHAQECMQAIHLNMNQFYNYSKS